MRTRPQGKYKSHRCVVPRLIVSAASMAVLTVLWDAEEPEVITKEITSGKVALVLWTESCFILGKIENTFPWH
jgi:hypothetical protein